MTHFILLPPYICISGDSRLDAINANPDPTNAQKKYRKKMDRYLENKLKKLRDKHETDSAAPVDAGMRNVRCCH